MDNEETEFSDRLEDMLRYETNDDVFEHMTLLKIQHPEIADALTDFERLTKRQMELLDERDKIEDELQRLNKRLEGPSSQLQEYFYNL